MKRALGFSIMETMVGIGIVSVVGLGCTPVFRS